MRVAVPWVQAASPRSSSNPPNERTRSTGSGASRAHRASEAIEMASDKRVKVTLACEECKRRNYITVKNKTNDRERIEMKKYCRWDRRHTLHKETR